MLLTSSNYFCALPIIIFYFKGSLTYRFFPREPSYVRLGVGGLQLCRFSVNIEEKFYSFYLCRISRKENNLIQPPVYTFVMPYLFYTYTFILLRLPCNKGGGGAIFAYYKIKWDKFCQFCWKFCQFCGKYAI
jgi:hypothetical protein